MIMIINNGLPSYSLRESAPLVLPPSKFVKFLIEGMAGLPKCCRITPLGRELVSKGTVVFLHQPIVPPVRRDRFLLLGFGFDDPSGDEGPDGLRLASEMLLDEAFEAGGRVLELSEHRMHDGPIPNYVGVGVAVAVALLGALLSLIPRLVEVGLVGQDEALYRDDELCGRGWG